MKTEVRFSRAPDGKLKPEFGESETQVRTVREKAEDEAAADSEPEGEG